MVFVPFISNPQRKTLERRKGGGGRGGGGRGSSSSGGSSGGGRTSSVTTGGSSRPASSSSRGVSSVSTIPAGHPFSGRSQGGGTRDQIYGNRQYGSGYPGTAGRGVSGRGFPFFFWPLAWGGAAGVGTGAYLHNREYGDPNNSTRPGGPLFTVAFPSISSNTTFRLLADNTTVDSLISDITSSCGSSIINSSSLTASAYNDTGPPVPEQTVQYYRASSVALTLDGYNNTAVFSNDESTADIPLPNNIDTNLLGCLNDTIGANVPLLDGAFGLKWASPPSLGLFALALVVSRLAHF